MENIIENPLNLNDKSTKIYFDRQRLGFEFIPYGLFILVGILSISTDHIIMGIIIIILFIIFIIKNIYKFSNSEPQMTFSQNGISIKHKGFINWQKITEIRVKTFCSTNGTHDKIVIIYNDEMGDLSRIEYKIDDLDTNSSEIKSLIKKYKNNNS